MQQVPPYRFSKKVLKKISRRKNSGASPKTPDTLPTEGYTLNSLLGLIQHYWCNQQLSSFLRDFIHQKKITTVEHLEALLFSDTEIARKNLSRLQKRSKRDFLLLSMHQQFKKDAELDNLVKEQVVSQENNQPLDENEQLLQQQVDDIENVLLETNSELDFTIHQVPFIPVKVKTYNPFRSISKGWKARYMYVGSTGDFYNMQYLDDFDIDDNCEGITTCYTFTDDVIHPLREEINKTVKNFDNYCHHCHLTQSAISHCEAHFNCPHWVRTLHVERLIKHPYLSNIIIIAELGVHNSSNESFLLPQNDW